MWSEHQQSSPTQWCINQCHKDGTDSFLMFQHFSGGFGRLEGSDLLQVKQLETTNLEQSRRLHGHGCESLRIDVNG